MWFQWLSLVGLVGFSCEFYGQFIYNLPHKDKVCLEDVHYNATCDYQCVVARKENTFRLAVLAARRPVPRHALISFVSTDGSCFAFFLTLPLLTAPQTLPQPREYGWQLHR